MKGVQCYELFGGIALKIHTFSFFFIFMYDKNLKSNLINRRRLKESVANKIIKYFKC